jgi:hypothetical protein
MLISMPTFSKQKLERQKSQHWVGDKLLPEIRAGSSRQSSYPEPVSNIQSQIAL